MFVNVLVSTGRRGVDIHLNWGWANAYYGYRTASAARDGAICFLSGVIRGSDTYITKLPKWCRPQRRAIFGVWSSDGGLARIDV